jgi:transposase
MLAERYLLSVIRPRSNSKPKCSGCHKARPGYRHMAQPCSFEFIPIYNIPVSLSDTMRRVNCPTCGFKVEAVPWAHGKHAAEPCL